MDNTVFDIATQEELQKYDELSQKAAKQIGTQRATATFFTCFFVFLSWFEYEVLYSVFRQLAGDDNPFWNPVIMSFSALILLVAVFFIAQQNPQHFAIRFIDNTVGKMVPIYLTGIGLLLAVLLYKYGLSAMLDTDNAKLNIETMQMEGQSWVSWIITHIASPLAAIVLSAGLGSLAIINVFVAHHAIDRAITAKYTTSQLAYIESANQVDIDIYFNALARFEEATVQLEAKHIMTDEQLKADVTSDVMRKLQEANNQAMTVIANI